MSPISKIAEPIRRATHQMKTWGQAIYQHWKIRQQPEVKPLIPDFDEHAPLLEQKSLRGKKRYNIRTTTDTSNKIAREEALRLWEGPPVVDEQPPPYSEIQPVPLRYVAPEHLQAEETKTEVEKHEPLREEARLNQEQLQQKKLETALGAGVLGGAVATGVSLGAASEVQSPSSPGDFDHILQKDTPIDRMVTFFEHNSLAMVDKGSIPLIATNQTISIEDTLEKTPVRGFDIDLHERNGEVVINHAGYYNPLVPDENIPRLHDALDPINTWLDKPENSDEVVFLNFENKQYLHHSELHAAFGNKVIHSGEYDDLVRQLGRAPTVHELTADGPKVVVIDHDHFITPGFGNVAITGYHHMPSLWEDRTLAEILGPEYHYDVAPKITTEDIDTLIEKGQGRFISLDQVSPNDPRFIKPEDRVEHALKTDDSVFGHLYYGNEHFQSALMGIGATASIASGALGVAGGAFQGVNNERQIRRQPKEIARHLQQLSLLDILQKRNKKNLGKPVTPEEIQRLYSRSKKGEITRNTLLPGISGTVSVAGSLLGLGMIFAPIFPALAATAAATGGSGLLATAAATAGNRKRIGNAIKRSFESAALKKLTAHTAKKLEKERLQLKAQATETNPESADAFLLKSLKKHGRLNRLQKLSQFILGGSLVVRISGLSKYGLPMLGTVAMGVGAALSTILVVVSAAINFKERRQRLSDLPGTMTEVLNPKLESKRFWLFGKSRFERYLQSNVDRIHKELPALENMSVKKMMETLNAPDAPKDILAALHECRKQSAAQHWEKKLTRFARKRKPYRPLADIRKKPENLRALLKEFAIKEVGRFAHNDTFRSGRNNTLKLALLGAFGGIFYLPLIGVGAGTLLVGLGVSKVVAEVEKQVFKRKFRRILREPGKKPADQAAHKAVNGLVDAWTGMLLKPDESDKTKGTEKPPLPDIKD